MKNIFNILYYAGISIITGFVFIISLFAINIQNIIDIFAKEKPEVSISVKDTSAYLIKPFEKQIEQIPTNKPKVSQYPSENKIENRTDDSNQTEVNLESKKLIVAPIVVPKDTNNPLIP